MLLFLINPEAGKKKFRKLEPAIIKLLAELKLEYKFVKLDNLATIEEATERHITPSTEAIVAVGGNATVNAILNAMASADIPLGIVPMSKTNYLAKSLGLTSWRKAIRALAEHDIRSERLGKVGKHYFIGRVEVWSHQNLLTRYLRPSGFLKRFFGLGEAKRLSGADGVQATLTIDDQLKLKGAVEKIVVELNQAATDGRLKVRAIGRVDGKPDETILYGNDLVLESDKRMLVVMGDETVATTPIDIRGLSRRIKLIVPKVVKPAPKQARKTVPRSKPKSQ